MLLVSSIFLAFVCDLLGPWATLENLFPTHLIQLQCRKAPAALWPGLKSAGWFLRNMRGRDQHHCWMTLPFASLALVLWSRAGHEAPPSQKCSSRKAWLETQEFPRTPVLSFYLEDEKSMSYYNLKPFLLYFPNLLAVWAFFLSCSLSGLMDQAGYFLCLAVEATVVFPTSNSWLGTGLWPSPAAKDRFTLRHGETLCQE